MINNTEFMNILWGVNLFAGVGAAIAFIAIIYFCYLEYKRDGDGVKFVEKIVKLAISIGLCIIVAAIIGAIVLKAATALIGIGALIGVLIGLINTRLNLMGLFSLIRKLKKLWPFSQKK